MSIDDATPEEWNEVNKELKKMKENLFLLTFGTANQMMK